MTMKPTPRRPRRRQPKQSGDLRRQRVAVVGLAGIGRQIAALLAASGIRSLLLVDHRTVTRSTQRREGYAHNDIGRMKAHSTAQACHEINPKMAVITHTGRSEPDISEVDVVVVCSGQRRQKTAQTGPIPLVNVVPVGSSDGKARIKCLPTAQTVSPAMPAPALASIIAGVVVHEIQLWSAGRPAARRTRKIELYDMTIRITSRA